MTTLWSQVPPSQSQAGAWPNNFRSMHNMFLRILSTIIRNCRKCKLHVELITKLVYLWWQMTEDGRYSSLDQVHSSHIIYIYIYT